MEFNPNDAGKRNEGDFVKEVLKAGAYFLKKNPGGHAWIESEGSIGEVSVRCVFRYLQIDTGPRR